MAMLHQQAQVTVTAGTTFEYKPTGLENAMYHAIDVTGTGTATIDAYHVGRTASRELATGVSDTYDTYLYPGAKQIDISAVTNDIVVSISSHTS